MKHGPSPLAGQRPVYESASVRAVPGRARVTGKRASGQGRIEMRDFRSRDMLPVNFHNMSHRYRGPVTAHNPAVTKAQVEARQEAQAELAIYGREACAGNRRFRYRQDDKRCYCACGVLLPLTGKCDSCSS